MTSPIAADPRIDPRIKAFYGRMPALAAGRNYASRAELLAEEYSEENNARFAARAQALEMFDDEEIAPSAGLTVSVETVRSEPDANQINLRIIRPDTSEQLPCV